MANNENMTREVGFNFEYEAHKRALLEKIDELRREFILLFTQRDAMLTQDRNDIYCRYMMSVGRAKYENFKLSVELRAIKLKVELAQAALNRNHRPNRAEIEKTVADELRTYFNEVERQKRAMDIVEHAEMISTFTLDELRQLFRVLVRRLHPDLHPDQSEELNDLYVKGLAAYRSNDIDILREIIKRLDIDEMNSKMLTESPEATLEKLTRDVAAMRDDIDELRKSFPFNIESNLLDPVWVKVRQDELAAEATRLKEKIAMYVDRLDILTN